MLSLVVRGLVEAAKAVGVTYGPKGGTVLLDRFAGLLTTKDGYTVSQETQWGGAEGLGAKILVDACDRVYRKVGDGTTTTALLTRSLVEVCYRHLVAGTTPRMIISTLNELEKELLVSLGELTFSWNNEEEYLRDLVEVSSNLEKDWSETLVAACTDAGKYGKVLVEDGVSCGLEVEIRDGTVVPVGRSLISFSDTKEDCYEGPLIAIFEEGLESFQDIQSVLEESTGFPQNPLLIIAPWVEGEALATLSLNKETKNSVVVPLPNVGTRYADWWAEDLAKLSGATLVSKATGMDKTHFKTEWFGVSRKVIIKDQESVFLWYENEEKEEGLFQHIKSLTHQKNETSFLADKDFFEERIARLSEGLVLLKMGGLTEVERKEKRGRLEDALHSLQSAMDHGLVWGGGATLLSLFQQKVHTWGTQSLLHKNLLHALLSPVLQGLQNAGEDVGKLHLLLEEKEKDSESPIFWDLLTGRIRRADQNPRILLPAQLLQEGIIASFSVSRVITNTSGVIIK